MSTWDGLNNWYYSGQGVLLMGPRTAAGKPFGLLPVGNVSSLKLTLNENVLEHKESQSGNRLSDLRIAIETTGGISAVLESINSRNLALALRGDRSEQLAGSVTAEAVTGHAGLVTPLKFAKVSAVVAKRGGTTLTAFVAPGTPWDYKLNADAGSLLINDGSTDLVTGLTTGGTAPSAVAVGNPTVFTYASTPALAVVGARQLITGLTGADAALVNGKAFEITVVSPTQVSVNVDTTGKTITLGTPLSFFDGQPLTVDYSFAGQHLVQAMTQPLREFFLRFEGLNTADGGKPVIVEVFKVQLSAAKELELISDTVQNLTMEGSMLNDPLQATGSKFFREILLRGFGTV